MTTIKDHTALAVKERTAASEKARRETAWEIVYLLEHEIMPLNFTLAEAITTLKGYFLIRGIKREG